MPDKNPSAAEVNSGQTLSFPCKKVLAISLEVEVPDQGMYDYLLTPVGGELQVGFMADLFDILGLNSDLGIVSINGVSFAELRRRMGHSI